MPRLIKKPQRNKVFSLRQFYERRNKVLVLRDTGGLGDILMQRMIFEDFHRVMPGIQVVWAIPNSYHEAAADHPFVHQVIDSRDMNHHDYVITYDTTTACTRYEHSIAPRADKHRSDIWAHHCGVNLEKHDMHLNVSPEMRAWAGKLLAGYRQNPAGPLVLLCPISAMVGKNLTPEQMKGVAGRLRAKGCNVVALHKTPIYPLQEAKVPTICGLGTGQWMAVINEADYVVSVDTSSFHCAGGLKRPLVGIFTFYDGKVYGQHYDFVLVQKHRDDGDWPCGPCYMWTRCPKVSELKYEKPCLTELTADQIMEGVEKMFRRWPYQNAHPEGK